LPDKITAVAAEDPESTRRDVRPFLRWRFCTSAKLRKRELCVGLRDGVFNGRLCGFVPASLATLVACHDGDGNPTKQITFIRRLMEGDRLLASDNGPAFAKNAAGRPILIGHCYAPAVHLPPCFAQIFVCLCELPHTWPPARPPRPITTRLLRSLRSQATRPFRTWAPSRGAISGVHAPQQETSYSITSSTSMRSSPPAEQTTTRQDQAWKSSTSDGAGNASRAGG